VGYLIGILILTLVVVVHEYGHYVAMRRNGIKVVEFSVGMFGPPIFSRTLKSGTVFMVRPGLIGGYAKPIEKGPESMEAATNWVKFKVYMAGMLFNCIAACLTLTVLTYVTGKMPVVLHPFVTWAPTWLIPIVVGVLGSFVMWIATPPLVVYLLVTSFSTFAAGVAGPIGIVHMGGNLIHQGAAPGLAPTLGDIVVNYAFFFYMLNVAIAGCNLLPIPPLDGGFFPVLLIEKIFGKRSAKALVVIKLIGLAFIIGLFVLCFYADIARILAGKVLGQQ